MPHEIVDRSLEAADAVQRHDRARHDGDAESDSRHHRLAASRPA